MAVALITAGSSIIVGILTFLGVVYTTNKQNEKLTAKFQSHIETEQAVTNTKLEELTREVREHNGFARRMPVVEEQIKVANHRLSDLERTVHEIEHERG